jgi:hypothetical protein
MLSYLLWLLLAVGAGAYCILRNLRRFRGGVIHLTPVWIYLNNPNDNRPIATIGLIDINDPFMTLTGSLLNMIPSQLRGGLVVRPVGNVEATMFCLINLDYVFDIESLDIYTVRRFSSGDLINAYVSSPAWPAFIYTASALNIELYTGVYGDRIPINSSYLVYMNGVLTLEVRGSLATIGPYFII